MILIRISGGIGNQLFQYIFGKYIQSITDQVVMYDTGSFTYTEDRELALDVVFDNNELYYHNKYFFSNYLGLKRRILKLLFKVVPGNKYISEKHFLKGQKFGKKNTYLNGYWQTNNYADTVLKMNPNFLSPRNSVPDKVKVLEKHIVSTEAISIHVRRGDYFSEQYVNKYGVCNVNYYNTSIETIQKLYPGCVFFVFSDDIQWVKDNLNLPLNVYFVTKEVKNDYWYIYLMSLCKHNIISNSSFSWWGAYLNNNSEKTVISPKNWVLNSNNSIALDTWMKI